MDTILINDLVNWSRRNNPFSITESPNASFPELSSPNNSTMFVKKSKTEKRNAVKILTAIFI